MSESRVLRRRRRAGLGGAGDESGFTLTEIVVAMMILGIVASGFATSMAIGLRAVAMGRQRQIASDLATGRIEHLRSVPYDQVALSSHPVHSTDTNNPDYGVTTDGASYDVTGTGVHEPLIVDASAGGVLHFEDPVQVGSTLMRIYQYVTWVDDVSFAGAQNYKRVTVVIEYKAPSVNGVSRFVRSSSLFTTGTVTVTGATTTIAPSSTTVGASTTTIPSTTTTAGVCPGDSTPPSGSYTLNGSSGADAGFTAAVSIASTSTLTDTCTPISFRMSNGDGVWGAWTTYDAVNPTVAWTLGSGEGAKTVQFEARDGKGNTAAFTTASITLDTTKPTTPATFTKSASCSGANRTAGFTWGMSTDANLSGYRLYRSTDGVSWATLLTVSATSASDTTKKSLDSVRYRVVGYDRAGNESNATTTIAFTKNQCA